MSEDIVVIHSYRYASQADLAVTILQEAGSKALVYGSGRGGARRGVEVVVPTEDANRARALLEEGDLG
jgi:hypothetical protein